jgi:spermidine/putrescine-binding protein
MASTDHTQPSQVYNNFGLQWFIPYFIGITLILYVLQDSNANQAQLSSSWASPASPSKSP